MHVIHALKTTTVEGIALQAGRQYLADDPITALMMLRRLIEADGRPNPEWMAAGRGPMTISRCGGFGDLLFLTPSLRALDQPVVACLPKYAPVLEGICRTIQHPIDILEHRPTNFVSLEDAIEFNPQAEKQHIIDVYAGLLGVTPVGRPVYTVTDAERRWAKSRLKTFPWKFRSAPLLGIQTSTSSTVRDYPPQLLQAVIRHFEFLGWRILLLGTDIRTGKLPVNVHNCDGLSFRQSCALISQCTHFLGPDSALTHIAGALDIPTVALFGSFDGRLRCGDRAPTIKVLQGQLRCAPCFHHARTEVWPDGPCNRTKQCEALARITPEQVVKALIEI